MLYNCAILDDYQNVARTMADWSLCAENVKVTVFNAPLGDASSVVQALKGFQIVCLMRERTPFPRQVIESLPDLRLIITTGMKNEVIDMQAASERGILVAGTESKSSPTAELVFAHMLEFARKVGFENARLKSGHPWQNVVGQELAGKTLGILGLGRLGKRVALLGSAFGMNTIAWSQNLTAERCEKAGVEYVGKEELMARSDYLSVHLRLSERTRGLIGADDLAYMKPTAFLINTSRSPIIDADALIAALREERIAGAGIDVFDNEPLALDHPLRFLDRAQITPHIGYVTRENLRSGYMQMVENICTFLEGSPTRILDV